jgi:DNA-binding NarL/FixJ family response regulator
VSIRVLLVDDHVLVRDGLAALLDGLGGFDVVGEAGTGEEAVEQARLLRPDAVLMDVRLPDIDGVEATRRIRTEIPGTAVLMLTMFDDDATVFAAMRAGAQGYLLKDAEPEDVAAGIRAVTSGQAIFGPGVAQRMLTFLSAAQPAPDYPFPQLTERERLILERLAAGRRTPEIAAELFLARKTVSNQLTSVFAKLGVADRAEAVVKARASGLGG